MMDPRGWLNMQAELFRSMVEARHGRAVDPRRPGHHRLRQRTDGRAARAGARRPGRLLGLRRARPGGTAGPASAPRRHGRRAPGREQRGGEADPPRRWRAVDPGQLVRAARRRRRAGGLAAPGRGARRPPGARGDAARARAAAGRGAEHRDDRQLGVGRADRHGHLVRPAVPHLQRGAAGVRRRTTASWTSCTRRTGHGAGGGRLRVRGRRRLPLRRPDHPGGRRTALGPGPGPRPARAGRRPGQDGRHRPGHHRPGDLRRAGRPGHPASGAAAADGDGGQPGQHPRRGDRPGGRDAARAQHLVAALRVRRGDDGALTPSPLPRYPGFGEVEPDPDLARRAAPPAWWSSSRSPRAGTRTA